MCMCVCKMCDAKQQRSADSRLCDAQSFYSLSSSVRLSLRQCQSSYSQPASQSVRVHSQWKCGPDSLDVMWRHTTCARLLLHTQSDDTHDDELPVALRWQTPWDLLCFLALDNMDFRLISGNRLRVTAVPTELSHFLFLGCKWNFLALLYLDLPWL